MEDCKLVEDQECTIVDDVELEEVCENMDKGQKISKTFFSSIKNYCLIPFGVLCSIHWILKPNTSN